MSFRSSLAAPSTSSGQVGTVITSAALFPPVANAASGQNEYLSPVTLPAGTWIVTSSVQIIDTAAAAGFQYVGISLNSGVTDILNYYTDTLFTAGTGDFVITSTNVLNLTDASTVVSLWVQAGTVVTTQTYQSWAAIQPLITATKIA